MRKSDKTLRAWRQIGLFSSYAYQHQLSSFAWFEYVPFIIFFLQIQFIDKVFQIQSVLVITLSHYMKCTTLPRI